MDAHSPVRAACVGVLEALRTRLALAPHAAFEIYDERSFRAPMPLGVSLWVHNVHPDTAPRNTTTPELLLTAGILLTPWAPTPGERLDILSALIAALHAAPVVADAVQIVMQPATTEELSLLARRLGDAPLPTSLSCLCRGIRLPSPVPARGPVREARLHHERRPVD